MAATHTLFTVHAGPADPAPPQLVPYRFSWAGFWLGPFWLVANSLWWRAALVLVLAAGLGLAFQAGKLSGIVAVVAWLPVAISIGLDGHEWRRQALTRRGAPVAGLAYGSDGADAFARAAFRMPAEGAGS